jgi:pantoate--beta-alanine ligase
MRIVRTTAETREAVRRAKAEGNLVGFVPTMGALHAGHLKLMNEARRECGFVVVSIFLNPTQFGPNEDLAKYPRDLDCDAAKCEAEGVDMILAPSVDEIYPTGFSTYVDVHGFSEMLEGASRPGHFRGVATVVAKLFNIVLPDKAYFGMKDYQQLLVIRKMVRDLVFPVEIVPIATVREPDGLAMSSRNAYLHPEERKAATALFRALECARQTVKSGERHVGSLRASVQQMIESEPLARVDYVAVVDPETLEPPDRMDDWILVALAVRIGNTRLIDNVVIKVGD